MSLQELSALYLPALENELRLRVGAAPPHLHEYYHMLAYHLGWVDRTGRPEPAGSGGKRLRPLLCLLCCAGAGGEWERALPMAAAIELLHNFSLIHDDIQDNSRQRRGRATVWVEWGQAQAINAGDAMFTLAHLAPHALTERGIAPAAALAALEIFSRTCLTLTQGQYLDMAFEQRPRVTPAEYLQMIEAKTAALISAAARLGARLGGANASQEEAFAAYGLSLGLAFQIQDDILGIWGDPAVTGKSAADDLEKRKKTLPVVFGLAESAAFAQAYSEPHSPAAVPIDELAAELEHLGARDYAQRLNREWTAQAHQHLALADPRGPAGTALREFTNMLLERHL